jgi:hypothetical protein
MDLTFETLRQARMYDLVAFPACVRPTHDALQGEVFIAAAQEHAAEIDAMVKRYGAVLFRGFGDLSPPLFSRFAEAVGPNFPYRSGNAVRTVIAGTAGRVVTANEAPPDKLIPFHHELAQTPEWPRRTCPPFRTAVPPAFQPGVHRLTAVEFCRGAVFLRT